MRREQFAVVAGFGIAVLIVAAVGLLHVWVRAGGTVTGRVVRFGLVGSFPVAVVQLEDRLTTVRLTLTHNCRIGDSITLRRRGHGLLGRHTQPCTAPAAD